MSTNQTRKFVTQSVTRKSYRFKSKRFKKRCNGERVLFFTPKSTKSPWFTRTFVLGCKIVAPLCAHSTKMQLVQSRRSRVWNPQLVCGMESTRSVECNQSEGEIHADAWCHTPSAITYSPAVRLHANPSDWIEKRPFENGLFSWCERRDLNKCTCLLQSTQ